MPKRIVLTTFGSLGDVHPYIAIGLRLQAHGHTVVLATSEYYRSKIEAIGLGFSPVPPDIPDWQQHRRLMPRLMHPRQGPEMLIREFMMPVLEQSYWQTLAAAEGADLLVSHPLTFTTPLVAEKTGLPWASTALAPMTFFSVFDPPPVVPGLDLLTPRSIRASLYRLLFRLIRWRIASWTREWRTLRARLGLPPSEKEPLFEGQHAPRLVLALFSELLGKRQRDWPSQTVVTGFPFYDQDRESSLPVELEHFLNSGPAPIVFTLGSSAVFDAGSFYEESARAAHLLGRRAVLLVGKDTANRPASVSRDVVVLEYAPYSQLFPRAAAVVHQGGIGTTAQALRSGRLMLIMPFGFDQPDNARRAERLGVARTISRTHYRAKVAARELRQLMELPSYARQATAVGKQLAQEDGAERACQALEALLNRTAARGALRWG